MKARCKSCNKEFEIRNRNYDQKYCSRSCVYRDKGIIDKMIKSQIKTNNNRYGVDYVMESGEMVKRFKKSIKERNELKINNIISKYAGCDFEGGVINYIKELLFKEDIIKNDKDILHGKEIDVYIPRLKIGFELCKMVKNSEIRGKKSRYYHINKTNNCLYYGIRLYHIFESDWNEKKEVVKSIIKNIFSMPHSKSINGKDCELLYNIKENDKIKFLNENDINKYKDNSSIQIGLRYGLEGIVSIMMFKTLKEGGIYEMVRYCCKNDMEVIGSDEILFNEFVKKYNPKEIIAKCDRRYFSGKMYNKLGFNFINNIPPSFYYISNDYKFLINSNNYRKNKLKEIIDNYDENISVWENMKLNGYDRMWNCGYSKWIWKENKI